MRSQPPRVLREAGKREKTTHLVHSDLLELAMVRKVGVSRQGDVQAASSGGGWKTPYILPRGPTQAEISYALREIS